MFRFVLLHPPTIKLLRTPVWFFQLIILGFIILGNLFVCIVFSSHEYYFEIKDSLYSKEIRPRTFVCGLFFHVSLYSIYSESFWGSIALYREWTPTTAVRKLITSKKQVLGFCGKIISKRFGNPCKRIVRKNAILTGAQSEYRFRPTFTRDTFEKPFRKSRAGRVRPDGYFRDGVSRRKRFSWNSITQVCFFFPRAKTNERPEHV